MPRKLPLEFVLDESQFRTHVDKYMQRALRKGVPPLFKGLKYLLKSELKLRVIEQLVLRYEQNLVKHQRFVDQVVDGSEDEAPTCLLWTYYFLAQLYDYLNQSEKALAYINIAIDHTPTLVELYMVKGKIYKHCGNYVEAVRWLDEAQSLDTADRFINYKCVKYMLRANLISEAQEIAGKFTRVIFFLKILKGIRSP
jgi:tetratricopeptide (TPR) repeat protein